MLVHVKISEGVPAALWLSTCGHLAPTLSTVGIVRSCIRCKKPRCIEVAHAARDPHAFNHHVELTVSGELLQAGAPLIMSGIVTPFFKKRPPLQPRTPGSPPGPRRASPVRDHCLPGCGPSRRRLHTGNRR
jgi:hypothetical protein